MGVGGGGGRACVYWYRVVRGRRGGGGRGHRAPSSPTRSRPPPTHSLIHTHTTSISTARTDERDAEAAPGRAAKPVRLRGKSGPKGRRSALFLGRNPVKLKAAARRGARRRATTARPVKAGQTLIGRNPVKLWPVETGQALADRNWSNFDRSKLVKL